MNEAKQVPWTGEPNQRAINYLNEEGKVIVCPTKVGYIIAVSDKKGLERKFSAKNRKRNKPGVVLCGSLERLHELAELNAETAAVYETCWNNDVLFGAILPWKESGKAYIPKDGSEELMTDVRGTSCFVIKFGVPGEQISKELWDQKRNCFSPAQRTLQAKETADLLKGSANKSRKKPI